MKSQKRPFEEINVRKRLYYTAIVFAILEVIIIVFHIGNGLYGELLFSGIVLLASFVITFFIVVFALIIYEVIELLGILAVLYGLNYARILTWSIDKSFITHNVVVIYLVAFGLLVLNITYSFNVIAQVKAYRNRFNKFEYGNRDRENKADGQEQAENETDDRKGTRNKSIPELEAPTQTPRHTKEELGRMLNLWQMKYSQATNEKDRAIANNKIKEYQDEVQQLNNHGTTPDKSDFRARR